MKRYRLSPSAVSVSSALGVVVHLQQQLLLLLLLLLLLVLRCSAARGAPHSPWDLPIPSDEELLAVQSAALSPLSPEVQEQLWGALRGPHRPSRGPLMGPPKLSRVDLFNCCMRDYLRAHSLVENGIEGPQGAPRRVQNGGPQGLARRAPQRGVQGAPQRVQNGAPQGVVVKGAPAGPPQGVVVEGVPAGGPPGVVIEGAPEGGPQGGALGGPEGGPEGGFWGLSVSFEVLRDLMGLQDAVQLCLISRALLGLKETAARVGVSPRGVSFMLPVWLQGWYELQQQKETVTSLKMLPPYSGVSSVEAPNKASSKASTLSL